MTERRASDEEKLARRRQERVNELDPAVRRQLEAGVPVLYDLNGETVKEYPDGRRFVVRAIDGGRSHAHVREVLSEEQQARIRAFVDEPDGVVATARAFGLDISLTLQSALLTPEERWHRANATLAGTRVLFGAAKRIGPTSDMKRV